MHAVQRRAQCEVDGSFRGSEVQVHNRARGLRKASTGQQKDDRREESNSGKCPHRVDDFQYRAEQGRTR